MKETTIQVTHLRTAARVGTMTSGLRRREDVRREAGLAAGVRRETGLAAGVGREAGLLEGAVGAEGAEGAEAGEEAEGALRTAETLEVFAEDLEGMALQEVKSSKSLNNVRRLYEDLRLWIVN